MEFRVWIGLWTTLMVVLLVAFNLSFLVKYITRFTEVSFFFKSNKNEKKFNSSYFLKDCFATLVAIIFIIDAIKSTLKLREPPYQALDQKLFTNISESILETTTISSLNLDNANTTKKLLDINDQLKKSELEASFYFSVLLFIVTFLVCMGLKEFRDKPFLPSKVISICN